MKKTNNKYRNNNQVYSLNYKFDSQSIAGKYSATALDLIRRYNELARDAMTHNEYTSAEIFRQYAEHYRKIVTEINEKKAIRQNAEQKNLDNSQNELVNNNQSDTVAIDTKKENIKAVSTTTEVAEVIRPNFIPEKKELVIVEVMGSDIISEASKVPEVKKTRAKRVVKKVSPVIE